jgi:hypothetical protein
MSWSWYKCVMISLYIRVYIYIHLMFSPMGWICWVESSKDCPKDSASGWSAQPWGVRGFSGDRRYTKIFWGFHKWRSPHFMDGLWWNILLNPFNTYFSMDDLGVPPHDLGKHLKNGGTRWTGTWLHITSCYSNIICYHITALYYYR